MGATNRDALRCVFYTVHFNKCERERATLAYLLACLPVCLLIGERKRNGRTEWGWCKLREKKIEKGRRDRKESPMVLPYGKSPAAMVNARVIGGRFAGLLREAKK